MKQVSNSLLTLGSTPFNAIEVASAIPRDMAGANNRDLTPFYLHRGNVNHPGFILLGLSCPPRSLVRSRLGEGRIRNLLQTAYCFLLAWLVVIFFFRAAVGAENIVIHLKEEAAVESESVYLKDVADVRGADSNLVDSLANLSLGSSPEFGSARILSRFQIGERIQNARGPLAGIGFAGAPAGGV